MRSGLTATPPCCSRSRASRRSTRRSGPPPPSKASGGRSDFASSRAAPSLWSASSLSWRITLRTKVDDISSESVSSLRSPSCCAPCPSPCVSSSTSERQRVPGRGAPFSPVRIRSAPPAVHVSRSWHASKGEADACVGHAERRYSVYMLSHDDLPSRAVPAIASTHTGAGADASALSAAGWSASDWLASIETKGSTSSEGRQRFPSSTRSQEFDSALPSSAGAIPRRAGRSAPPDLVAGSWVAGRVATSAADVKVFKIAKRMAIPYFETPRRPPIPFLGGRSDRPAKLDSSSRE